MVLCGGAGHSIEIVKRLSSKGLLIGIDRDEEALSSSKKRLAEYHNVEYVHGNHDNILEVLNNMNIGKVDGILLDLGVSSYQLDEAERGFSYMKDAALDMRMDKTQNLTAKEIVNTYSEEQLANIIYEYGEEKFSRKVAKKIIEARTKKSIETTLELVEIIKQAIPYSKEGHPAKRTFQAIRIEVNNEIMPLYETVKNSIESLKSGGRLCIITFHSLEDRAVKRAFLEAEGKCSCPPDLPYCVCDAKSKGKILTRKPILPSAEEQEKNAIISYEELMNSYDKLYEENEKNQYVDDDTIPINIKELYELGEQEKKLDSVNIKMEEEVLEEPIVQQTTFKKSPYISPVYGIEQSNDDTDLSSANQFLNNLKELKSNLE